MIKGKDAQFHVPEGNEPTWAETNFFGFYNSDEKLNVGVYALFRPSLGVVSSTICMNSRHATTPWGADFCDMRAAMPIPEPRDLCNYRLMNSLEVKCLEPNMRWTIKYDDGQGTWIDVCYDALMPPFDIHDPEMDPMCGAKSEEGKFSWGTAYNGHFDQTGRFVGEVGIRGKHIPIDCISTMDHSWGPRPERGKPTMSWLHAHFSEKLAMHAIFGFDATENGKTLWLAHGDVLDDGRVYGLKAGTGRTERVHDRYADSVFLDLTDSRGREWKLRGKGMTTFPWQCWPNMVAFNALGQWECEGKIGYGEIQDFFELPVLNALNSEAATHVESKA